MLHRGIVVCCLHFRNGNGDQIALRPTGKNQPLEPLAELADCVEYKGNFAWT